MLVIFFMRAKAHRGNIVCDRFLPKIPTVRKNSSVRTLEYIHCIYENIELGNLKIFINLDG